MKICAEECVKDKECCNKKECRLWIEYDEDLNCTEIAIKKNGNMTLKQVGERLGISYVRVTQIEKEVLKKIQKNNFIEKTY
jgi:hypothetical protein